jgi:acetyltransferase-like isoleucine patch superfamily enzyme
MTKRSTRIAASAIIHPGVILGDNVVIEDFCIIGLPNAAAEGMATVIGDNSVIRAGTYIYAGNRIGPGFQTGNKANIREKNVIGANVSIGTLSVIEHNVTLQDGVRIHSQAFVPEFSVVEKGGWIGPNVVVTNARYPNHPNAKATLTGVHICEGAKIGANSTLLPGVRIGANSLIGAGSVVVSDVPAGVVAAGSPARIMRQVDY